MRTRDLMIVTIRPGLTWRHFLAANPPMDTWSSVPALVDRESTLAGWHSVWRSHNLQFSEEFKSTIVQRGCSKL